MRSSAWSSALSEGPAPDKIRPRMCAPRLLLPILTSATLPLTARQVMAALGTPSLEEEIKEMKEKVKEGEKEVKEAKEEVKEAKDKLKKLEEGRSEDE